MVLADGDRDDGSGPVDHVIRPSGRYLFRAHLGADTAFEAIFTFIDTYETRDSGTA